MPAINSIIVQQKYIYIHTHTQRQVWPKKKQQNKNPSSLAFTIKLTFLFLHFQFFNIISPSLFSCLFTSQVASQPALSLVFYIFSDFMKSIFKYCECFGRNHLKFQVLFVYYTSFFPLQNILLLSVFLYCFVPFF